MNNLHNEIKKNFDIVPTSHRAGKWAIDRRTLQWLEKHNYLVDSSVRSNGSEKKIKGVYKTLEAKTNSAPNKPYYPDEKSLVQPAEKNERGNILEVPVTGIKGDFLSYVNIRGWSLIRSFLYKFGYKGVGNISFRPSDIRIPVTIFKNTANSLFQSELPFINFMFHSSELALGTSPYSKTEPLFEQVKKK